MARSFDIGGKDAFEAISLQVHSFVEGAFKLSTICFNCSGGLPNYQSKIYY